MVSTSATEESLTKFAKNLKKAEEDDLPAEDRRLKNGIERLVNRILTGKVDVDDELLSAQRDGFTIHPETDPTTMADKSPVEIRLHALDYLLTTTKSATSTMTAIPKPIKFLRPHFTSIQLFYEDPLKTPEIEVRKRVASLLSVIATTIPSENRLILHYYFEGLREPLSLWGLEYQRALAREISEEYFEQICQDEEEGEGHEDEESKEDTRIAEISELVPLGNEIISLFFDAANETEAIDLAIEIQQIPNLRTLLAKSKDVNIVQRVCRYILACHQYISDIDERNTLVETAFRGYLHAGYFSLALIAAIIGHYGQDKRTEDIKKDILEICAAVTTHVQKCEEAEEEEEKKSTEISMDDSTDDADTSKKSKKDEKSGKTEKGKTEKSPTAALVMIKESDIKGIHRQLGYILGSRNLCFSELEDEYPDVYEAANNNELSSRFRHIGTEFGANAPKVIDSVLKSHLEEHQNVARRASSYSTTADVSINNLSGSIVNGLLNCGFGTELLFESSITNSDQTVSGMQNKAGHKWIDRLKAEHKAPAIASLGLVHLWDVDEGFSQLDAFESSTEKEIQAGAALAFGVLSTGIQSEMNATIALLSEKLEPEQPPILQQYSSLALGLSYIGTQNEEIMELLVPLIMDGSVSLEVSTHAALGLGLTFLGSASEAVANVLTQALLDRLDSENMESAVQYMISEATGGNDVTATTSATSGLAVAATAAAAARKSSATSKAIMKSVAQQSESCIRLIIVALGLIYTGTGVPVDYALEILKDLKHPIVSYLVMTLTSFAYLGSGSVEKVQSFMGACVDRLFDEDEENEDDDTEDISKKPTVEVASEDVTATTTATTTDDKEKGDKEKEDKKKTEAKLKGVARYIHQDAALLGVSAINMGEDLSSSMSARLIDNALQCGDVNVRRTVPLSLALLNVSNPTLPIVSQIFKLTHDKDEIVARRACLALGIVGFGTNNAKVGENLRYLATYFATEYHHLFFVQVAQGMLYAGKGLITLAPRTVVPVLHNEIDYNIAGILLAFMHIAIDPCDNLIKRRFHLWMMLAAAIRMRVISTVTENGEVMSCPVRVGQAADIVGQPGNPRHITGFQTQNTPVMMNYGQAAEIGTDDYLLVAEETPIVGVVVMKKNPNAIHK